MPTEGVDGLESLIQELVKAWKRMVLYPPEHPSRRGALERPFEVLRPLTAATGSLRLGVARDGLLSQDTKMESAPARELARALYYRNVAVLRFQEAMTLDELSAFLLCLRSERGWESSDGESFEQQLAAAGIANIQVDAVDYTSLVVDDEPVEGRKTSLWERIVQSMLGGAGTSEEDDASLTRILE